MSVENNEFKISKLWDGTPLSLADQVTIHVDIVDQSEPSLIVKVEAPFYNDPKPIGEEKNLDGLWNYEVVELFIKGRHDKYLEIEMGPHGHYLVLVCDGYRQCFIRGIEPISYKASINPDLSRWSGTIFCPLNLLPPPTDIPSAPYSFNAYSIHGTEPNRSYAALFVPWKAEGDYAVPDFHKLELFEHFPHPFSYNPTIISQEISVWKDRTLISVGTLQKTPLDVGEESPRLRE